MKKVFTLLAMMLLTFVTTWAQSSVVLPIYSSDLIDQAPAGKVVTGAARSGFSYYYEDGTSQGGYNDGFVGEYVLGNDGCIYLKDACASAKLGTYLKLEKVDDENYVAHTAQLIWVDNSGSTPFTAFATRLVFQKLSDYSYTYVVESDKDGKYLTDIYFTYKDGVLQQKDQEVIDMNGQKLPHELIAFTNSKGGFIGFGDGCITIKSSELVKNQLPADAQVKTMSFSQTTLSSRTGLSFKSAQLLNCAEVGDDFYMTNPGDGKNWIKGKIDRKANTVTFEPQYVGINDELNCHQWFRPATYNDWKDVFDPDNEEDGFSWKRDFKEADKLVCRYDNGSIISDPDTKQAGIISLSGSELQIRNKFADITIKPYEAKAVKPTNPTIIGTEDWGFGGAFTFAIPNVDEDGVYLNPEELSYCLYVDNETEPYTFKASDFSLDADKTEIPYKYADDMYFDQNDVFHNIYYDNLTFDYFGVQTIYRHNGEEKRSDIVWYNHTPTGISNIQTNKAVLSNGKWLEKGKLVIKKNDHKYNLQGMEIK